jgi:hypothetical protein
MQAHRFPTSRLRAVQLETVVSSGWLAKNEAAAQSIWRAAS